jgi:uncharacterized protein
MSTDRRAIIAASAALLAPAALIAPTAWAQVLSSPIGQSPAAKPTAPASASKGSAAPAPKAAPGQGGALAGVPTGQGAGVHGPNSPFAPLPKREDVIAWSVLTAISTKNEKNKILPVFGSQQMALNQKTQKIQGFMMPLEPGEKQRHFLLTSVPLTCGFCLPGGPESMVEVRTKTPVKYSLEPVVVEGKFQVLGDDPYGLYYRVTDAVAVK